MMRPSDAARLLLLAFIWGSSFLLIKIALEGFNPWQIVFGRLAFGALFLFVFLKLRGRRLPGGNTVWVSLFVMALVSNVIPFGLITWGEESITSSLAAILNSTTPLFTAALAALFLHGERLTPLRAGGIGIGFAGVAVIVGIDTDNGALVGELAIVAASLSYAVGFVYARRHIVGKAHGPVALSTGQLLAASLISLPLASWFTIADPGDPTIGAASAVFVLGVAGTGIGYSLYYRLVGDVGATSASFVTYLLPVFGVALGAVFRNEAIGLNTIVGALLVIAGIAVAGSGASRGRVVDNESQVDARP